MNDSGDDRRVRKTKKALRQGLMALLGKKSLKDISVRELTDAADLHRGTFYIHYKDIYDLYDKICAESLGEVGSIFDQHPPEELMSSPCGLIRDIMEYAAENRDLCRTMLGPRGDQNLVRELCRILEEKCLHDWSILFPEQGFGRRDYLCGYVVTGCMGVVRHWAEGGMAESPQEMAALLEQITHQGLGLLGEPVRPDPAKNT